MKWLKLLKVLKVFFSVRKLFKLFSRRGFIKIVINEAKTTLLEFVKDKIIEVFNDEGFKFHIVNEVSKKANINKTSVYVMYDEIIKILIRKTDLIFSQLIRDIEIGEDESV